MCTASEVLEYSTKVMWTTFMMLFHIYFHCVEESSVNILQNITFSIHRRKVIQVWNDKGKMMTECYFWGSFKSCRQTTTVVNSWSCCSLLVVDRRVSALFCREKF